MSVEKQKLTAEFVRKNTVPAADAESFVHFGIDNAYHPTGGYWFPTGKKWGDSSGWVSRKTEIPHGDLIQFPSEDREPEIRGRDELPDWVVDRTIDDVSENDGIQDS